jgi:hypothetical protein
MARTFYAQNLARPRTVRTTWRRRALIAVAGLVAAFAPLALASAPAAHAQAACATDPHFLRLVEQNQSTFGSTHGNCAEPARTDPASGNIEQRFQFGHIMIWRKADGVAVATNGHASLVLGPDGGVRRRLNTQRFSFETDPAVAGAILLDDAPPGVTESQNTVGGVPISPPTVSAAPPAAAPAPASSQAACATAPAFTLVASILGPEIVGSCVEPFSVVNPATRQAEQRTTTGLYITRPAEPFTGFTNGYETWMNAGSRGFLRRLNTQRFEWEPDAGAPGMERVLPPPYPTPANSASNGTGRNVQPAIVPPPSTPVPAPAPPSSRTWEQRVDPAAGRLVEALVVLRNSRLGDGQEGRLRQLAASDVTIGWGPLPAGVNGLYSYRTRRITVADRHRNEPLRTLAPVLAHELVHAFSQDGLGTPADCLNDEISAFEVQALVWSTLYNDGPDLTPTSALARDHEQITEAFFHERLGDAVLLSPGYQVECLGGAVNRN